MKAFLNSGTCWPPLLDWVSVAQWGPGRCRGIGEGRVSPWAHGPGALEEKLRRQDGKCAAVRSLGLIIFVGLWL